jgi:two-component system, OmpR family, response regulator
MLVLSRKLKEKIVLPTLHATIHVVGIGRGGVRLGIDAPPEITILREEVPDKAVEWKTGEAGAADPRAGQVNPGKFLPALRKRLRATGMALGVLRIQFDTGQIEEAEGTLARMQSDFQLLLHGVDGEAEQSSAKTSARSGQPRKALLVEDDRNERELLAGFLRHSGLAVDTAGDGAAALNYLVSHDKPDVLLLDMGLPRVDGPSIVREVRRNPAFTGLKIFAVSGHRPEEFGLEQGPRGVDCWFTKPLNPTSLLNHMAKDRVSFCRV